PKLVEFRGQAVSTSILKEPVGGRVLVRRLSLEGDWQADLRSYGGMNKAVHAYPLEHYARWSQELGRDDLRPGQFGENLTLEGLTEETVRLGDVIRVGSALLQVTQPRYPCFRLGIRMGAPLFPRRLPGQRADRVLPAGPARGRGGRRGRVGAGGEVRGPNRRGPLSLVWVDKGNVEGARRALRCPTLAREWRQPLEER